jgi:hypothetical protein
MVKINKSYIIYKRYQIVNSQIRSSKMWMDKKY